MKHILILCLLMGLGGCSGLIRKDGNWFEAAGHPPEQFERDNYACHIEADRLVDSNWAKSYDNPSSQINAYNAVYSRCMAARNYRPRAYFENWLPFG